MVDEQQQVTTVTPAAPVAPKDVFEEVFGKEAPVVAGPTEKTDKRKATQKVVRQVPRGLAFVQASYNNTIVSFTDPQGNVIASASAGQCGFKGPKKSTAYAAGVVVRRAMERANPWGLREIDVFVKGVGSGREAAIRALNTQGLVVIGIRDLTPIPHNGCRPPKVRRV